MISMLVKSITIFHRRDCMEKRTDAQRCALELESTCTVIMSQKLRTSIQKFARVENH